MVWATLAVALPERLHQACKQCLRLHKTINYRPVWQWCSLLSQDTIAKIQTAFLQKTVENYVLYQTRAFIDRTIII
jgi:hypothetical protein